MGMFDSLTKIFNEPLPEYSFVERKFDDEFVQVATKIGSGKYEGLVFSVGNVSFEDKNEEVKLNYNFKIEFAPQNMKIEKDLDNIIGDIIMDAIMKDIDSKTNTSSSDEINV